ncbi:MAG: hypothetical protein NT034_03740 [Candidatus Magasanikbacteria bacterium]|nr:hypothetical protein [Candidatus Magasanikbacteria bacterium]
MKEGTVGGRTLEHLIEDLKGEGFEVLEIHYTPEGDRFVAQVRSLDGV